MRGRTRRPGDEVARGVSRSAPEDSSRAWCVREPPSSVLGVFCSAMCVSTCAVPDQGFRPQNSLASMATRAANRGNTVANPFSRRLRRRPPVVLFLAVLLVFLIFSVCRRPSSDAPKSKSWSPIRFVGLQWDRIVQQKFWSIAGASKPNHLPSVGSLDFGQALASCRITDLVEDPLVKEYGQNNIRLSRTYEGSGARVRKMLQKAISGQPIHVAVVGGSVSSVSHSSCFGL